MLPGIYVNHDFSSCIVTQALPSSLFHPAAFPPVDQSWWYSYA
jgi:hypothetical protein